MSYNVTPFSIIARFYKTPNKELTRKEIRILVAEYEKIYGELAAIVYKKNMNDYYERYTQVKMYSNHFYNWLCELVRDGKISQYPCWGLK